MLKRTLSTTLFFVALTAIPASAGEWNTCGGSKLAPPGGQINFRLMGDWLPGNNYGDAFLEALGAWNGSATDVALNYFNGGNADPEDDTQHVYNDVYWALDLNGAAAVTTVTYSPQYCTVNDRDIMFSFSAGFSTTAVASDLEDYGGDYLSFQAVAIHEIGHALGLKHTAGTYSCMGLGQNHLHANGGWIQPYPGEDAVTTTSSVFGYESGTYNDLALAHWRYAGHDHPAHDPEQGDYAVHVRTRLLDAGGSELNESGVDPVYDVESGQQVRFEVTVENLGKTSKNTTIDYYISTNNYITTFDTLIGSQALSVGPNVASTITSPVLTLPANLFPATQYWVGAVIDPADALSEVDEWNNSAYVAVETYDEAVDIDPFWVSGPGAATAGEDILVIPTLENLGGEYNAQYSYELYLSTDNTITKEDVLLKKTWVQYFGTYFDMVTIPANLPAGSYYYGVLVDPALGETVVHNNAQSGSMIEVEAAAPDLVATWVSGPNQVSHGQPVTIQCVVNNVGGALNGPYNLVVRLSTDSSPSPLYDLPVTVIQTNQLGLMEVETDIPPIFDPGQYYWVLTVSLAGDGNMFNNYIAGYPVTVEQGPDAAALSIGGPSQATALQPVTVSVDVASLGDPFAGGFDCVIGVKPLDGALFVPVHSFHTNASGPQDVQFSLPATTPPGKHQWLLRVSSVDGEYLLDNNTVIGGTVRVYGPSISFPPLGFK